MRKEQIVAIILGSLIGIAVAFGIWRMSQRNELKPAATPASQNQKEVQIANQKLTIVSPQNNAVLRDTQVLLTGLARPNSIVAVYTDKVYTKEANGSGEFVIPIEISDGFNNVVVWSFEKQTMPQKAELTLIQTSKLDMPEAGFAQAIMGTVTDISEDSIQIRTKDGEIEQLSLTPDTTYASTLEESVKELKFKDLAIGDLIAALGTKKQEGLFEIGRILVTTEPEKPAIAAIVGTVDTLTSKEFLVQTETDKVSIDATGSVDVFERTEDGLSSGRLGKAEPGADIVVIGNFKGEELIADTIILL